MNFSRRHFGGAVDIGRASARPAAFGVVIIEIRPRQVDLAAAPSGGSPPASIHAGCITQPDTKSRGSGIDDGDTAAA